MALTTDQYLEKIGSFGRYQILLLIFLNGLVFFWFGFPVMIPVFITAEPPWRCVANSSVCKLNGTMNPRHDNYSFRCDISRDEWEFVDDFTSVVTEVKLVNKRRDILSLCIIDVLVGKEGSGAVGAVVGVVASPISSNE